MAHESILKLMTRRGFAAPFILIGTLLLLLAVGGVYYLGKLSSPLSTPPPSLNPAPMFPASDATANWKKYINTKIGFSIKYPSNYPKPALPSGTPGQLTLYATGEENRAHIIFGNTTGDSFYLEVFPCAGSVDDLVTMLRSDSVSPKCKRVSLIGALPMEKIKEVIISGVKAEEYITKYPNGSTRNIEAYFVGNGRGFILGANSDSLDKDWVDQVLSTFRFTEQSQADLIAGWKTYESSELSFKYPPGWQTDKYSGYGRITSSSPKVELLIFGKNDGMMNECMGVMETKTTGNLMVKKYSRVLTGAMCSTGDSTGRENWITKAGGDGFQPGVIYKYSSTQSTEASNIFDQILSTFKFTP